jgi:KaiC/GvpD/RAD55 family RecA-like ATPase
MERISTGIKGLDEMLKGGIPKRRHVALSGGPGCGKTSLSFQFLYYGAKNNEPGAFISLEETEEDIIENMKQTFSALTDIDDLINQNKLNIIKPEKFSFDVIAEHLEEMVVNYDVKRFVIDSATIIKMSFPSIHEYRQTLYEFFSLLRNLDCTGIITVELDRSTKEGMRYDIEHYVADGVINLYALEQGERRIRALEIMKMRATDHSRTLVPFKVFPSGIEVYPGEKVYVSNSGW